MQIKKFEVEVAGKKIIAEFGRLAMQANGSVTVQLGDTVILATAVMSKSLREGLNYFPLWWITKKGFMLRVRSKEAGLSSAKQGLPMRRFCQAG